MSDLMDEIRKEQYRLMRINGPEELLTAVFSPEGFDEFQRSMTFAMCPDPAMLVSIKEVYGMRFVILRQPEKVRIVTR